MILLLLPGPCPKRRDPVGEDTLLASARLTVLGEAGREASSSEAVVLCRSRGGCCCSPGSSPGSVFKLVLVLVLTWRCSLSTWRAICGEGGRVGVAVWEERNVAEEPVDGSSGTGQGGCDLLRGKRKKRGR